MADFATALPLAIVPLDQLLRVRSRLSADTFAKPKEVVVKVVETAFLMERKYKT
jgi:hypothetical protein